MKTKKLLSGFMAIALLALFALPTVSLGNTYRFIDSSGNLQSMEASNPTEALATAYQLGIHSGVVFVNAGASRLATPANTTGFGNYYQFIDTSSNLQGLWAANSSVALATAYQLGIHSGVVLVD